MDIQSQEVFDTILKKDKDSLSMEEIGFLMARRSYLNDADRARYADLIKKHEKGELFPVKEEEEALGSMTLKQLKALAKELEVKGFDKMKAPALIDAIKVARGEATEDDE